MHCITPNRLPKEERESQWDPPKACHQSQHPWNTPHSLPNSPSTPYFPDLVFDSPAGPPECEVCLWTGLEKDHLYFLHSLMYAKLLFHRLLNEETGLLSQGHCPTANSYIQAVTKRHSAPPQHVLSPCMLKHVSATHICF